MESVFLSAANSRPCVRAQLAQKKCFPQRLGPIRKFTTDFAWIRKSNLLVCTKQLNSKRQFRSSPEDKESFQDIPNDADASFGLLDLNAYCSELEAPWGLKNSVFGMVGWGASFLLVGLAFIPIAKIAGGPGGFADLSQQEKSIFALINQIIETAVGIGVIATSSGTFYNKTPSVLKLDVSEPFRKPNGWLFWALIGILLAPEVVFIASSVTEAFGAEDLQAKGTADAISQILSLDQITFTCLFTTTAILAPLLEETVFRGFLLPSLAKFMPTPLAVVLSSIAFGLVHFSPRDTPQLTALGILLGFSYIRSGNLLTPMLIHGTWNGTVLTVLYILQANGYDINALLHSGQI